MIRLLVIFSLLALAFVGYERYRAARQQALLTHALQQLTNTLGAENDHANERTQHLLQQLADDIAKYRNLPPAMRVLRRAQNLANQASALRDTLRATSNLLHHTAQARPVAQLVGTGTRQQQALRRQLASYGASMRQANYADTSGLIMPAFDHLSVAEAQAVLAELESAVLGHATQSVQRLARQLPASEFQTRQLAAATAESAVVAPGTTYRARLRLVSYFATSQVHMYCDSRPVAVSADGIGRVQFRAPKQPGSATWTASIYLQQQGSRDTIFAVRVPYRVARR